jgi:hypothetical protein
LTWFGIIISSSLFVVIEAFVLVAAAAAEEGEELGEAKAIVEEDVKIEIAANDPVNKSNIRDTDRRTVATTP